MSEINGVSYLTIKECMERLPFIMSERAFRAAVRASGHCIEHRRQLALTEADLAAVLASLKPRKAIPPCRSSSPVEAKAKYGTSKVRSAESVTSKALALVRENTQRRGA